MLVFEFLLLQICFAEKKHKEITGVATMEERVCEMCGAPIPEDWLTPELMGTCPTCKKLVSFIEKKEESEKDLEERKRREEEQALAEYRLSLITKYCVYSVSDDGKKEKIDCIQLAKLLMTECGLYFHTVEDEDTGKQEIFYYENGYYHRGGDNRIKSLVDRFLENDTSIHRKNEVLDYIKNTRFVKRREMEPPVNLINVKNGVYDLHTDKLVPHSHEYFFLNQIPVEYNPKADCPKVKKFFSEILYPEFVPVMQEAIGYCLYREYIFHKAFMLLGGGRNGKGTTVNLINALLGDHNCSAQSLHSLVDNRFAKSSLYGKLINMGAEMSGKTLTETADFKNLTGGEPIMAERKNYGAYSFRNYAKLFFNVNNMVKPRYDKSQAYFDRWIIFAFPKTFDDENKDTVIDLIKELTTKEELEGLLNWLIDGLKRLLKNRCFSPTPQTDVFSGEYYENLMKPEYQFINDYLMIDIGMNVDKDKVYQIYEDWAKKRRYPILSRNSYTRAMKSRLEPTRDEIKKGAAPFKLNIIETRMGDKRVTRYESVTWKSEVLDEVRKQLGDSGVQTNFESYEDKVKRVEDKMTVVEDSLLRIDDGEEQQDESDGGIQW